MHSWVASEVSAIEAKKLVRINMAGCITVSQGSNILYLETECCTKDNATCTHIWVKFERSKEITLWVIDKN